MSESGSWKPVLFVLMGMLGLLLFSDAPFTFYTGTGNDELSIVPDSNEDDPHDLRVKRSRPDERWSEEHDYRRSRRRKKHHDHGQRKRSKDSMNSMDSEDSEEVRVEKEVKTTTTSPQDTTEVAMANLNPKPPLDLPIVKPEMLKDDPTAKTIPTRQSPFHFHIPIVSKNPLPKLSLDELMEIAKKYRNPLNYNPEVIKAASLGQILTEKQLQSIRRMVRDSPVLDFLNMATVIAYNEKEIDLVEVKRSVIPVFATDQVLQDLFGDEDDLQTLQDFPELFTKREDSPQNENDESDEMLEANGLSGEWRRRRVKRGLGKWLKKVFGLKKDEPTTKATITTSTTPKPKGKKKGKGTKKPVTFDANGDTKVDALLPKSLRRSSYLKSHVEVSSGEVSEVESNKLDYSEEEEKA